MKRTINKLLSILLIICMVLQYIPAAVFAVTTDDLVEDETVYTEIVVDDADLPDNDELFAMYVEQELYDSQWTTFGTAARENLNAAEQGIYDALKAEIENVAANGGSTTFILTDMTDMIGLKTEWTAEELGVESIEDTSAVQALFEAQYDQQKIIRALLSDCPFDLYWFDKTAGAGMNYSMSRSGQSVNGTTYWTKATVTQFYAVFYVSASYQDGSNTAVTSDVAKVGTAKVNAQTIVDTYASETAYNKLAAYRDEICNWVEYNDSVIDGTYTGGYGDPWQLIYVFDGDESTMVVCEGYSKAFQYLCDLSGLDCISVTGDMYFNGQGGGHMWNLVTMNGSNYLVDVTNCDSGFSMLFMAGTSIGSVAEGYSIPTYTGYPNIDFIYDAHTLELWSVSDLTLAATNYDPNAEPVCTHNYESVVTAPTCTAGGFTTHTCTLCGDSYIDSEAVALGHSEEVVPGYAATCTEAGLTDGAVCSVCEEVLNAQEEIPALGHTEETVPGQAATCTEAGLTDGIECGVCGEVLTAQEEIPALGHNYENGACTGCGTGVILNAATGATYATLADAVAAAAEGQTLQLQDDWTEAQVMVTPGITLDLNGHQLTSDYLVCFETAHLVDNAGSGRLNAAMEKVVLDAENAMVPVYDGEGYLFTKAGFTLRQDTGYTGQGIKINAAACPVRMDVVELLKDGSADNDLQVVIVLSWDTADGVGTQEFVFKDSVVADVYTSNNGSWGSYGKMFSMIITGTETVENLTANIALVSGTNVSYDMAESQSIS